MLPGDTRPPEKFDDPVKQAEWDAEPEWIKDLYRLMWDQEDRIIVSRLWDAVRATEAKDPT